MMAKLPSDADFDSVEPDEVYSLSADDRPSAAVYTTVAELSGQQALEMVPLAETIDPEALDLMFDGPKATEANAIFRYADYYVVVTSEEIRFYEVDTETS